ncbi:nucleotidyltransferase domain-containing protein [Alkalicoccobacillus murimartini]|uniref:Nucleotidyltransferase n=1 Tax=Alkalicoccobacillus murimartini TaxID=171685 RepID=A0ABT9YJC2_9BACI|nr:nucleotidyltransferase domain-containing protein [Alkalicoccobacillus murimartini]MDQ0207585.1 putative nucleotidyltransferase [Alkalicoccobacillus murimartini]
MTKPAFEVASEFITHHFPNCSFAVLAGSTARGEETPTSDLDIVIFDEHSDHYRESFVYEGWKIEAFVHHSISYRKEFEEEKEIGRPILGNMLIEGLLLKDHASYKAIAERAVKHVQEGPAPLTEDYIKASRYFIGDLLDDFIDSKHHDEAVITLNQLSLQLPDFILRLNNQWSGRGKGLSRALYAFDHELAQTFFHALRGYYQHQNKEPFIAFVTDIYKPLGGFLFDGFSLGKK